MKLAYVCPIKDCLDEIVVLNDTGDQPSCRYCHLPMKDITEEDLSVCLDPECPDHLKRTPDIDCCYNPHHGNKPKKLTVLDFDQIQDLDIPEDSDEKKKGKKTRVDVKKKQLNDHQSGRKSTHHKDKSGRHTNSARQRHTRADGKNRTLQDRLKREIAIDEQKAELEEEEEEL